MHFVMITCLAAAAAAAAAVLLLLRAIGFTNDGVRPGSLAACWQSKIGDVPSKSLFSSLIMGWYEDSLSD